MRKKAMKFYTPDEVHKLLSVEEDLNFRCLFQTLFYCGFSNGDLWGLTWVEIYFNKMTLSVNMIVFMVRE